MHYNKILSLALASLSAVAANDIRFYDVNACNLNAPFRGCGGIGPNTCCYSTQYNWAVSISKAPLDVAIGWTSDLPNPPTYCEDSLCTAGGSGTLCCLSRLVASYTGGSFYTISKKRGALARRVDETECTSSIKPNIFGLHIGGEAYWQIAASDVIGIAKEGSDFASLQSSFETVSAEEKLDWLKAHGATYVAPQADSSLTQTIQGTK